MEKMTGERALMQATLRASACIGTDNVKGMAAYVTGYLEALSQTGVVDSKEVLKIMQEENLKHDTN